MSLTVDNVKIIIRYFSINLLIIAFISCSSRASEIQNGDIIFQESLSSQSDELAIITGSRYTHMGIIYKVDNQYYVYEAIKRVTLTPLDKWIKRGKDGHYVIKRLKNADRLLTAANLKKMKAVGKKYRGKKYDSLFQWSDSKIYCSELVWKIYKEALDIEIGKLQKFKDFDLTHPKVKSMIKKRYGGKFNTEEKVISPVRMYESDLLEGI
jgi:hypothetical protein